MSLMKKGEGMQSRRLIAGFTLIELMIVVVVVGILAAIAYPNYTDQVRKSRRGLAKADLVEYAQMAERWHTVNNAYDAPAPGFALPVLQSPREAGSTARYRLNLVPTANTFVITATPLGKQADDTCGTLSLSNTGVKTNSSGVLGDCW